MNSKYGSSLVTLILFTGLRASTATATDPQTIENFKKAVQAADNSPQGTCDSIPFQNLREKCQSLAGPLQEFCKDKPRTCEGLETKPLLEKIKGIESKIQSLKSSTSTDDDKKKIPDLEREVEFTKKSRETDMSDASIRIDNGQKCLDIRSNYSSVFKDALSKANDERDSDIRDLRDKLVNYWEARARAHDEETNKVARQKKSWVDPGSGSLPSE